MSFLYPYITLPSEHIHTERNKTETKNKNFKFKYWKSTFHAIFFYTLLISIEPQQCFNICTQKGFTALNTYQILCCYPQTFGNISNVWMGFIHSNSWITEEL